MTTNADNLATSTPETKPNALERRVDLLVAIADLEKDMEARLKRLGKNLKVPGFRPGKVPLNIVRQQYGAQAQHELLSEALDKAFGEAVAAQNFRVAGYPRIEPKQADGGTHLAFSAIFEVYPEFTLGDVSGQTIARPVLEVSEAEVDRTIDILRKQRVRYEEAQRPAGKDDRVVVDFLGKKDGEPFQGGQANDYPFVLGQGQMLPDFEKAAEGLSAGDSKTFDLTFPEDYFSKELAGKTVSFDITVKKVEAAILPEMDEAFANSLGVANGDVQKMREEIGNNLKREVKNRIKSRLKERVMDALEAVNPIDVPNALVEMEVERLVEAAKQDMAQRGMKVDSFPIQPAWFADQAFRRVKLGLILAELVKTEKLQANPEQVKALVEEAAQTYENPEEVVRWYFSQPERLQSVEAAALEDNVAEWVLARAQVSDEAVAFDELMGQKA